MLLLSVVKPSGGEAKKCIKYKHILQIHALIQFETSMSITCTLQYSIYMDGTALYGTVCSTVMFIGDVIEKQILIHYSNSHQHMHKKGIGEAWHSMVQQLFAAGH